MLPETEGSRVALFVPSLIGGGAERGAVFVGQALERAGYLVDLVVAVPKGRLLEDPWVKTHHVDLGASDALFALPAYVRYLRRARPDLVISFVHGANFLSGLAALFENSPKLIISVRGALDRPRGDQWWLRRIFGHWIEAWLYGRADRIQVISHALAAEVKRTWAVPDNKLVVTLNTAEIFEGTGPDGDGRPDERPVGDDTPYLISIGRLASIKGFDAVIRAFSRSAARTTHRLLIVGEGPQERALRDLAREEGVETSVFFPGFQDPVFPWLNAADGFVYASKSEGFGRVVQEALVAGLPVAAFDCPGVAELLDSGRLGRLVPMGDVDALAQAMDDIASGMLGAPDEERLRAHLGQYSAAAVAERYVRMVDDCLAG